MPAWFLASKDPVEPERWTCGPAGLTPLGAVGVPGTPLLLSRLPLLFSLSLMSPLGTVRLEVSGWSLSAWDQSCPCWGRSAWSGFGLFRLLVCLPLARRYYNDRRWVIFSQRPELAVEQSVLNWKVGC